MRGSQNANHVPSVVFWVSVGNSGPNPGGGQLHLSPGQHHIPQASGFGAGDAVSAEMTPYFHVTPAGKKRQGCPLGMRPARTFLFFQKALVSYTLPLQGLLVLLVGVLSILTHSGRLESTFSGVLMHTGCISLGV